MSWIHSDRKSNCEGMKILFRLVSNSIGFTRFDAGFIQIEIRKDLRIEKDSKELKNLSGWGSDSFELTVRIEMFGMFSDSFWLDIRLRSVFGFIRIGSTHWKVSSDWFRIHSDWVPPVKKNWKKSYGFIRIHSSWTWSSRAD